MKIESKEKYIFISNGNLKVVLSCLGAAIVEIKYDDDLLTLTPVNYQDLNREDIYYGKTIGPIANRIKDGLIKVDDKCFYFPLNENGVANHSGKEGLSNKLFDFSVKSNKVIFNNKDNIFNCETTYEIAYSFLKEDEIRIDYKVTTTDKAVLSLTNHTFFTLGENGINNLLLKIKADSFIESDKDTLVSRAVKPIVNCLDFNKEKLISRDIDDPYLMNHKTKGYDHCFLLNERIVRLDSSKYTLTINTDFPCVHIYSDNYSDGLINKNTALTLRRAVAIEPEDNLLEKVIINNKEIYQRYILYSFVKK